ncbi:MAG: hypothetical protein ABL900_18700 [Burkholderiaceae bacterium]
MTVHFDAPAILRQLDAVQAQRQRRRGAPDLKARVDAIKQYQQRRFTHTYADLLASDRYRGAARFFLDEMYGPQDFTERDAQLARVVPALVRLFSIEVVDVVGTVVSLHALSEQLDSTMGQALPVSLLDAQGYAAAWRATGEPALRERQIALTVELGAALDRLVHKPLLRRSLHLMRGPARLAGLGDLQEFLERGFEAFRAMQGAEQFLALVAQRERQLAAALFNASDAAAVQAARALLPPATPP